MYVNAFDVINGTLLLTRLESVKIRTAADIIDEDEEENAEPQKIKPEIEEKTLSEVSLRDRGQPGCRGQQRPEREAMAWQDHFFRCFRDLTSMPEVMWVLCRERCSKFWGPEKPSLQSAADPLAILGSKVGEIKVTEVMKDRALVSVQEGSSFRAGQIIRFKK